MDKKVGQGALLAVFLSVQSFCPVCAESENKATIAEKSEVRYSDFAWRRKLLETQETVDRYKEGLSELAQKLETFENIDVATIPPVLRKHLADVALDNIYRYANNCFDLGTNQLFIKLRKQRNLLVDSIGEFQVASIEKKLNLSEKTRTFLDTGRDGISLTSKDSEFVQSFLDKHLSKTAQSSMGEEYELFSTYFYNYRLNNAILPFAIRHASTDIDSRLLSIRNSVNGILQRTMKLDDFVRMNLIIDRSFFAKRYGVSALNQIDDYLGTSTSLRDELKKRKDPHSEQLVDVSNKGSSKGIASNLEKCAKAKREQIWTKIIPNRDVLESTVSDYLTALFGAALDSSDVYVLYSQDNWPKRLYSDLDADDVSETCRTKMNTVLRNRWLLENFTDSACLDRVDESLQFVYSSNPANRPLFVLLEHHPRPKTFERFHNAPPGTF